MRTLGYIADDSGRRRLSDFVLQLGLRLLVDDAEDLVLEEPGDDEPLGQYCKMKMKVKKKI
jgi:hypothetical protein